MPTRLARPKAQLCTQLDAATLRAFEAALHDPLYDKPRYGLRGQIIEALLRDWLLKQGFSIPEINEEF